MAEKLVMLALSPTMETGTIAKWNRGEGDAFSSGDVLCEVETDKATMDYEATSDGIIRKIIAGPGAKVRVGDIIAISGAADEDISRLIAESQTAPAATAAGAAAVAEKSSEVSGARSVDSPENSGRLPDGVKASPLARQIARQRGIDLRTVQGSGPGGRIVKTDLDRAAVVGPKSSVRAPGGSPEVSVPLSDKRRIIAARLTESKLTSPHFYLTVKTAMDGLLAARAEINRTAEPRLSLNAFLVKLVAEALHRHPQVNASWAGDSIIQHGSADVALVVAQPDGLVTPVVRDAGRKGIITIDSELRDLIARAREGKLAPEEYSDSTFTISNLGSYGVHQFSAIINPPNAAILSVGEVFREPFEGPNGTVAFHSVMFLTLACDHRIIDGAAAGAFARDLKKMIEQPISALL